MRKGAQQFQAPAPEDAEEMLVVEIYLASRRFESKIQIPLMSPDEDKRAFIDQWLGLLGTALKLHGGPDAPKKDAPR